MVGRERGRERNENGIGIGIGGKGLGLLGRWRRMGTRGGVGHVRFVMGLGVGERAGGSGGARGEEGIQLEREEGAISLT